MTDPVHHRLGNQSDGADESGILRGQMFAISHELPQGLLERWHKHLLEDGDYSGPLSQVAFWPPSLDHSLIASLETAESISGAAVQLSEKFQLWASSVVDQAYTALSGAPTREREYPLTSASRNDRENLS